MKKTHLLFSGRKKDNEDNNKIFTSLNCSYQNGKIKQKQAPGKYHNCNAIPMGVDRAYFYSIKKIVYEERSITT